MNKLFDNYINKQWKGRKRHQLDVLNVNINFIEQMVQKCLKKGITSHSRNTIFPTESLGVIFALKQDLQ